MPITLPTRPDPESAEKRYLAAAKAAGGAVAPRWVLFRTEFATATASWLRVARRTANRP